LTTIKAYQYQSKNLRRDNKPPRPLEFYYSLGDLAFDFIDKIPD